MTSLPWCRGGAERQHRVFDSTVRALKWLSPSLPGEAKDSVLVKKLLAGEGDWECVKDVLGWTINTKDGTVALPECKLQELRDLLDISNLSAAHGEEGTGALGREAPLNAPNSAKGGGTSLPHPTCAVPGGNGQGLAVS